MDIEVPLVYMPTTVYANSSSAISAIDHGRLVLGNDVAAAVNVEISPFLALRLTQTTTLDECIAFLEEPMPFGDFYHLFVSRDERGNETFMLGEMD